MLAARHDDDDDDDPSSKLQSMYSAVTTDWEIPKRGFMGIT